MTGTDYRGAKVLVTGATGFTGIALTRRLVEVGACVRAIARPTSDRKPFDGLPIQWIIGDVFEPAVVREATEGVAYIFHMATSFRHPGASQETNNLVHITSTKLLAEAVQGRPEFRRFVHVSTIGVHGHIENPPGNEESPFTPGDEYQRTKAEAELWIRDYAKRTGLPITVLRPCGLYGPGDTRFLKLFKASSRRFVPALGPKNFGVHLIYVDDFVDMALRAGQHPAAVGEALICGSPKHISLEDFAALVAAASGRRATVIRLPAWPLVVLACLCEAVCRPFGIDPPLHRRRVAFFTKNRSFDTSKLRRVLGYECAHPDAVGVPLTLKWYIEHGWLRPPR